MSDLFVSWTGDHAKRIGELIRSLFDQFRDTFQVFLSSRDIQEGTEWQDSLLNNLHNAGDGVVIFGQEAIKSDWLIHESAVLSSRTSKRLTVFRLGAPEAMLPAPLRRFQHVLLTRESLGRWLDRIIEDRKLSISLAQRDECLGKVVPIVTDYEATHVAPTEHKWKGTMARPIAISKQIESPFEVSELIRIARERLILIAQNHALMTDPNGARDTIEQLLFDGLAKGLVVDIIAMHPKVSVGSSSSSSDACQVWTTYMGAPHFMAHVKRCWDTFNLWNNRFKNDRTKWPGKLRIRPAYFLPVSINIVDPERQYGLLVISPRMAQEANSTRLSSSQLSNMNQPYLTSIGRQSEIAPITQAGLKLTSYHRRSPDLACHAPDYR